MPDDPMSGGRIAGVLAAGVICFFIGMVIDARHAPNIYTGFFCAWVGMVATMIWIMRKAGD